MADSKSYPKMIYKDDKNLIVHSAAEHALKVAEGWSGEVDWGTDIPELEKEIERDTQLLEAKIERLDKMRADEEASKKKAEEAVKKNKK